MTLLFLVHDAKEGVTSDTFLQEVAVPLTENYVPMTQLPLDEMRFGEHPVTLAEEVIALTASTNWRRQSRRPIMRGDIICRGADPWVVLKRSEITIPTAGKPIIPLRLWPNYAIFFLDNVIDELQQLI